MKPKLLFLAIYILIVPFFTTAQTDTSVYAVFMKGTVKGTQKIWKTDENTYHYFYQIFDRGRGDSLLTKLKTIIQEAQIPESYYNSKNSNYGSNWIHSPPLATGVANGAIETVKDIPVLVSFGADVALNSTTRHQLKEGLKQLNSWENIKTAASKAVTNWTDKYSNGGDVAWHQAGKDAVGVYCGAKAVATIAASFRKGIEKEVDEIAEEVSEDVANTVRKSLDDLINEMKSQFPNSWKFNKLGDDAFEVFDGTGKKWATVYEDKIVAPARTVSGTPGNPVLNKVPLLKNIKYEVDDFIYETDELGRVLETTADLDDIARIRLGNQQIRAVDIKDGVRGVDQGGHIVGSRFFGPGEQINLYPMSANLNLSAWKQMENIWADAMVAGKDVKIKVKAIYSGTSQRPMGFEVDYWIDGQISTRTFPNN